MFQEKVVQKKFYLKETNVQYLYILFRVVLFRVHIHCILIYKFAEKCSARKRHKDFCTVNAGLENTNEFIDSFFMS